MSIKIYSARRTELKNLPRLINDLQARSYELLARFVVSHAEFVKDIQMRSTHSWASSDEFWKNTEDPLKRCKMACEHIIESFQEIGRTMSPFKIEELNHWPIRVNISIWVKEKYAYFGVFDGSNNLPGLDEYIDALDYAEDYAYYNNSDPPEDIPESEWDERGRIWDALLDEPHMHLDVIDFTYDSSRALVALEKLLGIGYFHDQEGLKRICADLDISLEAKEDKPK